MSRGPGKIERAISEAFASDPDNAYTTEDICLKAYPGVTIEKKHRVAAIRAMNNAVIKHDLKTMHSERVGSPYIIYNQYNAKSFSVARNKAAWFNFYQNKHPRGKVGEPENEIKILAEVQLYDYYWYAARLEQAKRDGETWYVRNYEIQKQANNEQMELTWHQRCTAYELLSKYRYWYHSYISWFGDEPTVSQLYSEVSSKKPWSEEMEGGYVEKFDPTDLWRDEQRDF